MLDESSAQGDAPPPLRLLGPDGAQIGSTDNTPTTGAGAAPPPTEAPREEVSGGNMAPAPAPPKFERESPALITAREQLWRMRKILDDEIEEARSAKGECAKENRPLSEFLRRLTNARKSVAVLHATAYASTLEDRYDALQPLIIDAQKLATRAGIKLGGQP